MNDDSSETPSCEENDDAIRELFSSIAETIFHEAPPGASKAYVSIDDGTGAFVHSMTISFEKHAIVYSIDRPPAPPPPEWE